jgi:hypothetical protein
MRPGTAVLVQGRTLTVGILAREICTIQPDDPLSVACVSGTLWLTIDHDARDIVLERGQSWIVPAQARCLVYAFQASEARLSATSSIRQVASSQHCEVSRNHARWTEYSKLTRPSGRASAI